MFRNSKCLSILMAFLVTVAASASAQDNNQRKQRFDDDWKFLLGALPTASAIDFDDSNWRNVDLPHDWSIEGKVDSLNPTRSGGGFAPAGMGWYRKTFVVPPSWRGKSVSVYFEGVYMNSEVFLNGKSLGVHPYGYTSFAYDLSPVLRFDGGNVLSVRVDNSKQMNSRWYSGSGIYRHVWLIVTNPVHVANWGVGITTPEVSSEKATVEIRTVVKNDGDVAESIALQSQLLSPNAANAEMDRKDLEIPAHAEKEVRQIISISRPALWSPETPHLYTANIQVMKKGRILDNTRTTFGVRSTKFTVENGFQLNGKAVKMNGGCVHHDNGCLGAAAFDRAEERRVELLKSAGFNAIRTSHNPPSEAFLDACDRLGMIVIDEAFDCWKEGKTPHDYAQVFNDWWRRDIETMVLRDRNHPSIVLWSTGNEILENRKPEAVQTATALANWVRTIDQTRPVTSAITTWDKEWEVLDPLFAAHDIAGYNYQMFRAPSDHKRVPNRIIVQTESFPRDAFSNWEMLQNHSYIIGDFVWTALDYLGESGIGRWYYTGQTPGEHWQVELFPWHAAYCGDLDLTGWRKPISHYRNILHNNTEKLYMAVREPEADSGQIHETLWSVWPTWESWSWPGREGKNMQVEVYSKYPRVRLYLDTRLIGELATTREQQFKATFTVPYAPGSLRAVGVVDGTEGETTILRTAGDAAKIKLIPDRMKVSANGQDLSFVRVEITDSAGNLEPNAQHQLQFSIDGPGMIAGVDNANVTDLDPYAGTSRKAWHGRALVVIRSTRKAGNITLTAHSAGLSDTQTTISAENLPSAK
jgi:beta-galactosidase